MNNPILSEIIDTFHADVPPVMTAPAPTTTTKLYPLTQTGCVERIVDIIGKDKILFLRNHKTWYVFNGKFWEDNFVSPFKLITDMFIKQIRLELAYTLSTITDNKERNMVKKAYKAYEKAGQQTGFIKSVLEQLSERRGFYADNSVNSLAPKFDNKPDLLNFQNGTLNLKTGKLHPHKPTDLMTKCLSYNYKKTGKIPKQFIRFMQDTHTNTDGTPNNELIDWLQMFFGSLLSGRGVKNSIFTIFFGVGANGKTVTTNILQAVMECYMGEIEADSFTSSNNDNSSRFSFAQIPAMRGLICEEGQMGGKLKGDKVKKWTGDSALIQIERKGVDVYSIKPQCQFILSTNHKPRISDMSNGQWRRLRVIPFKNVVKKPDRTLTDKLTAEKSEIMQWLVAGCLKWYESGFQLPGNKTIDAECLEYKREEDIVGGWIDSLDELYFGSEYSKITYLSEHYKDYRPLREIHERFKADTGSSISSKALGAALRERGWLTTKKGIFHYKLPE